MAVKVFSDDRATALGVNTSKEVKYWKLMTKHGAGIKLLATFNNGVIMDYVTGTPLIKQLQYGKLVFLISPKQTSLYICTDNYITSIENRCR